LKRPSCGKALLIKLQVREHLDARDNTGRRFARERHGVMQDAVDAVPHEHSIIELLYMDVGGVLENGVAQERIHDADDRQVLGHFLQILAAASWPVFSLHHLELPCFGRNEVTELFLERFLILKQGMLDGILIRKARKDLEAGLLAHGIYGRQVFCIEHRHFQVPYRLLESDECCACGQ
jgi:hypothetical protein